MKKNSLQILLIISLVFNLAFMGSVAYRFIRLRNSIDQDRFLKNLPPDIKERFKEHKSKVEPDRREIDQIRFEFMAQLRNPEYNEEILHEKLEMFLSKQAELERTLGNNLILMRSGLSPKQAEKFFSHFPCFRHRAPFNREPSYKMRKFYENPR
jgi:hypothetical protein